MNYVQQMQSMLARMERETDRQEAANDRYEKAIERAEGTVSSLPRVRHLEIVPDIAESA